MKVPCLLLFILLPLAGPASSAEFITLFNGKNLDGWLTGPDNAWVVQEGLLTVDRKDYDGQEHNADYLWTKEQFGDFVLDLEYKIPSRANSGIFIRTPNRNNPVYTGIEVQVANSFGQTNLSRTGTAGAIYDCLAPTKNPIKKPGEWNRCVVTCQGAQIKVELNGEQIISMNLDEWIHPNKNPDGSPNKFATPLKNFARKGHIGLQDHGRPVWYRNVKIKRL